MIRKNVLLTGATGFVGNAVLNVLHNRDFFVTAMGRTRPKLADDFVNCNLDNITDYSGAFNAADVFVHVAARAHVMKEVSTNPLTLYREVNSIATINLARQAAANGIKRFIFVSSVKVNGESTQSGIPFRFDQAPQPQDPYGISKAEAEVALLQIATETGMDVVIIRPPLVYGLGVKANFAVLLKLTQKRLPLPLGAVHNKRSLVALDNLVDLIVTCIDHPMAANQTFLVSDDQDVSTTELLEMMIRAAGKTPMLIPVPVSWLKLVGKLTGKQAVIDRLCSNLQVDITHTKQTLDWVPPITVEEGIRRCFVKEDLC